MSLLRRLGETVALSLLSSAIDAVQEKAHTAPTPKLENELEEHLKDIQRVMSRFTVGSPEHGSASALVASSIAAGSFAAELARRKREEAYR